MSGPTDTLELEMPGCPICGSDRLEFLMGGLIDRLHWLPGEFGLARCPGCEVIVTAPRPSPASIGRFYPDDYVSYGSMAKANSALGRLGKRLLRAPYRLRYGDEDATRALYPGRVLDIGCGAGVALVQLAGAGWEAYGIEPGERAAEFAREQLGNDGRISVGRAEDASFDAESFDLIMMSHVIEHLHEPRVVLERVREWLRPGGLLLLRAPNVASLERRLYGKLWFGLDVPRHLQHFTPLTLRRIVEVAGLEVIRVRPQFQASSLSGSTSHAIHALFRSRAGYRHSDRLYRAGLPLASVLLGFGQGGAMELLARRRDKAA